jgi:hypothetical protein
VLIMIHGMGYVPGRPALDPHRLIYAPRSGQATRRYLSWPRHLRFTPAPSAEAGARPGLCIGFGWDGGGGVWAASRAAEAAAHRLARLVQMVHRAAPGRRVDLFAHSLGARVALGAVPLLHAGALGRVFLLAGAEFACGRKKRLDTPAGRTAEFFNVTTRENDLFDLLFEISQIPLHGRGRALGPGCAMRRTGWTCRSTIRRRWSASPRSASTWHRPGCASATGASICAPASSGFIAGWCTSAIAWRCRCCAGS